MGREVFGSTQVLRAPTNKVATTVLWSIHPLRAKMYPLRGKNTKSPWDKVPSTPKALT